MDVIIISHGHGALIPSCIANLQREVEKPFRTFVINNFPSDEIDTEAAANCTVVNNVSPLGFAANANLGFKHTSSEQVLLLNPDTRIHNGDPNILADFIKAIPTIGCVGALLNDPDGTRQKSARCFPTAASIFLRGLGADALPRPPAFYKAKMMDTYDFSRPSVVDWVTGAFMVISRTAFDTVGGFDERYRLYYEDVDFCHRLASAGYATWFHPGVSAVHDHARDSASGPFRKTFYWHLGSAARYVLSHPRPPVEHTRGAVSQAT